MAFVVRSSSGSILAEFRFFDVAFAFAATVRGSRVESLRIRP
jgi:hypothetical protein